MMLRHMTRRQVKANLASCIRCVGDVDRFMRHSRYTYSVARLGEDRYEIIFKWVKWRITRFYRVRVKVETGGDWAVIRSTPDSDYKFEMRFKFRKLNGSTDVEAEVSMDAGLMASLLGRGDFAGFVEELVDSGIVATLSQLAERAETAKAGEKPSCSDCLLYDESRSYCYYLRAVVRRPEEPPCGGEKFLKPLAV